MFMKINEFKFASVFIDFLRITLGITLVAKGMYFLTHMNVLFEHMSVATTGNQFVLAHVIVATHIVGGLCITVGLLTRIMAAINFPILFGAITMVHLPAGRATQSELEAALLVFALICVAIYYGSSKRSVDYMINHNDDILEHDFLKHLVNISNRKQKPGQSTAKTKDFANNPHPKLKNKRYKHKTFKKAA